MSCASPGSSAGRLAHGDAVAHRGRTRRAAAAACRRPASRPRPRGRSRLGCSGCAPGWALREQHRHPGVEIEPPGREREVEPQLGLDPERDGAARGRAADLERQLVGHRQPGRSGEPPVAAPGHRGAGHQLRQVRPPPGDPAGQRAIGAERAREGAAGVAQLALPVEADVERGGAVAAGPREPRGEAPGRGRRSCRPGRRQRAGIRVGAERGGDVAAARGRRPAAGSPRPAPAARSARRAGGGRARRPAAARAGAGRRRRSVSSRASTRPPSSGPSATRSRSSCAAITHAVAGVVHLESGRGQDRLRQQVQGDVAVDLHGPADPGRDQGGDAAAVAVPVQHARHDPDRRRPAAASRPDAASRTSSPGAHVSRPGGAGG